MKIIRETLPLQEVSPGHRYGCFNTRRGGPHAALINIEPQHIGDGKHVQIKRLVTTNWIDQPCGHDLRMSDPSCTDCINRAVEP